MALLSSLFSNKGRQGIQGPQGDYQGSQGSQGWQGTLGFQGAPGAGFQGPQGELGVQGDPGAGFQGAQGWQGTGTDGAQGAQGWQGIGTDGVQGAQGWQGNQGPQASSSGGGMTWAVITTGTTTATAGNGYLMNGSAGAVTLNLPAGTPGNLVGFADVYGKATTSVLTIVPNGTEKIHGAAASSILTRNYQSGTLAYVDATRGWEYSDDINGGLLSVGTEIHAATNKATPVDADEFSIWDSITQALQHVTWANIKATLKSYFDTLYATIAGDGWITIPATDYNDDPASTSTITMSVDYTASILPNYQIRYTTNGVVRYGVADTVAANLLTIGGPPLTDVDGDVTALAYRKRTVGESWLFVSGPFADAADTTLLANDMYTRTFNGGSTRYLVKVFARPMTDDTGASQPVVNVYNATDPVLTTGLTLSDASWAESVVAIDVDHYQFLPGAVIELGTGNEGTNDDAVNLAVCLQWTEA